MRMRPTRPTPASRKEIQLPHLQRGFLLIMAVVLIVIAALLLTVMMFLGVTGTESSASHSQSARALFIAESGVERALYGFSKEGTACASLTYTAGLGEGNFSTTGTLYAPAATALSAAISATDTFIPVASVAGYAPHGRLTIGAESINYTGSSATSCGAFSAPCFTGIQRGAAGSTAAAHALAAAVNQSQCLVRSLGTVGSAQRTVERAISSSGGNVRAMAVYAKLDGDRVPYYRIWDGTSWGTESTALAVGTAGNDIRIHFIVLKFARTRNEAILGVQYLDNTTGSTEISVQRWNGTAWTGLTTLVTGIGGDDDRRGFDIEYETANDRAVVVYRLAGNNTEDPDYRIWDGASWTGAASIGVPTTRAPRWIELATHPGSASNEIAMILSDRNDDVYGMYWDGSNWQGEAGLGNWSGGGNQVSTSTRKAIDVAYEQNSGEALFMWGRDQDDDQYFRTLSSGAWGTRTIESIAAMGGRAEWIRLAPRSNSDQIMYVVQDDGQDLNSMLWNGSSFGSKVSHDPATEVRNDRNFDVVFETYGPNTHLAWLVWGNGGTLSRKQWDSNTASWGGTTTLGDDTGLVQLMAHPTSGVVLAAIYEDRGDASNDDLREMHLPAGGAWSPLTDPSATATDPFWAGQTVNSPVDERVTLAPYQFGFEIYDWIEVFP